MSQDNAISNANANLPTGNLDLRRRQDLYGPGERQAAPRADAYGPTIVAYRNGNPVRLDEIAHVFDGVENDKTAAWFTSTAAARQGQAGDRSVFLAIRSSPAPTVVQRWSTPVRALLPTFQAKLAASGASLRSISAGDRAGAIKESVGDVKLTLLSTVFLVVLVIFLFLRNISATIIPSLALPGRRSSPRSSRCTCSTTASTTSR